MNPDFESIPLRDIHLPEPISWWPLASGWWILLALIVISIVSVVAWKKYKKKVQLREESLSALSRIKLDYEQNNNIIRTVKDLSELLRRVSITQFPRQSVASLTGKPWLEFLDTVFEQNGFPEKHFNTDLGGLLISMHYRYDHHYDQRYDQQSDKRKKSIKNDKRGAAQIEMLFELCHKWIMALPLSKKSRESFLHNHRVANIT